MKGVALVVGVLLLLGGGAVAGAQYVPDILARAAFLDSIAGAKEFLASSMALYAGGGAAGLGFILFVIGLIPGGKKPKPVKAERAARPSNAEARPTAKSAAKSAPQRAAAAADDIFSEPRQAAPKPAAPRAAPQPVARPAEPRPEPVRAAPKPVASGTPPPSAAPAPSAAGDAPTWIQDPRLANRRRVSDLVTINDALKAYREQHGKYPPADALGGFLDRGKAWIPGLSPAFVAELPRDPAQSSDRNGPQYLYVSDGSGYKLVARGVSLVGGTNVEVLGVRLDPSRQNTAESATFGFWTEGFEQKQ